MEKDKHIKVNALESEIKRLEREKIEIQNSCNHKETKVKFVDDTNQMRLYCITCNKAIGYPNQDEMNEFLR